LRLGVGHYASRYLQRHLLPTAGPGGDGDIGLIEPTTLEWLAG